MATERENQVSMTLPADLKLNSVKSSLVSNNSTISGGGIAYNKGGVPVGNSLNEPLRGNKILLYGRGLKYFSPLTWEVPILMSLRFFLKTPTVGPFEACHIPNQLFDSYKVRRTTRSFSMDHPFPQPRREQVQCQEHLIARRDRVKCKTFFQRNKWRTRNWSKTYCFSIYHTSE